MGVGAGHAYCDGHVKPHPDAYGTLVWTDQPCGRFGRDVDLGLSPGTEVRLPLESPMLSPGADTLCCKYVLIDRRVEHGDYVVRYIVRNKLDYVVNGGCYMPPGANAYHHHYYGGNHTAAAFDYNPHYIPGFHPRFSFAPSHVPHNPVHAGTNINGVGETLAQGLSQETQILKEAAKTTQTSGVHQALNTQSEGTHVKCTEYEGEQRNISTEGRSIEKSKMAEVDIGRIRANVGVTEQVQHQGEVSRGAQYEAHASGEALDVTVLAGGENIILQSGTDQVLQSKSVRETTESSMGQVAQTSTPTENITTAQTSAGLANRSMTGHVSISESHGQYGGQGVAGVSLDSNLTIYPGTSAVMGSATREVVQESIQGVTERQLSAQQTTQTNAEVNLGNASSGRVTFTDGSAGVVREHRAQEERVQGSVTAGVVVETEMQRAMETAFISSESTRQSLEASAGAGLSIENAGGRVSFAESVGQYAGEYGGRVGGGVTDVTIVAGREIARETGMEEESRREVKKSTQMTTETSAREVAQTSTREIIQTSAQEITQTSAQEISQSLTVAQQTGQASLDPVTVTHSNAHSAAESLGNYRGQVERGRGETVEVTILAGTEGFEARETTTSGVVRGSTRDIVQSSAQVTAIDSVRNHRGQVERVEEETVEATILTGTKDVETRETITGGVVQESTRDIVSSAHVTTIEVSADERSGNHVTFAEVEGRGGGSRLLTRENTELGMVQQSATESSMQLTTESSTQSLQASAGLDVEISATGAVNDTILLAGQSGTRESATSEAVLQGSTQGISQSSTQVTTQTAGGGLITETVTRVDESIVPGYICGLAESGAGVQVSVAEQTRGVRELEGEVYSSGAIGKLVKEAMQGRISSSEGVVQTSTGQVGTTGVGTSTLIAVVDSERYGREQAGDVVSSSVENAASAAMRTSEVVGGTIVDAVAIANERFDAAFGSSEVTLVNKESIGIATAVSAEDSRVNVTSIAAGERVDTRVTSELEGGVQTVITSGLSTEVNMVEVGDTENIERECTYPLIWFTKLPSHYMLHFPASIERVHREITESTTSGRHASMSRSSSSTHSDNWDVVSRAASSTLVPTLHTLASTEQIQTIAGQTRSVSFERHLTGISTEVNVSANSETVL